MTVMAVEAVKFNLRFKTLNLFAVFITYSRSRIRGAQKVSQRETVNILQTNILQQRGFKFRQNSFGHIKRQIRMRSLQDS